METHEPVVSEAFKALVVQFATATGLAEEVVAAAFKELTGTTDDAAVALLQNMESAPEISTIFTGKVAALKLKAAVKAMQPAAPAPAEQPVVSSLGHLLPEPPSESSFLEALQVGGVLKAKKEDVLAAVRVLFFMDTIGSFDLEAEILGRIEQRAVELEEPVPEIFHAIDRARARKAHADVLRALDVSSGVMTVGRRNKFVTGLRPIWSRLAEFYRLLANWVETDNALGSNARNIVAALARGGRGVERAPTTSVVDASTTLIDGLNKMFAGLNIPVARGLAADAQQTLGLLGKSELIIAVGATTRDEMFRKLRIAVSPGLVGQGKELDRFVLGILGLKDISVVDLPDYIMALKMCGDAISWDKLTAAPAPRLSDRETHEDDPEPAAPARKPGRF